jgi:hypothetical protein
MADVFISYARADDEAYAHRLHENLGAHGVDVATPSSVWSA